VASLPFLLLLSLDRSEGCCGCNTLVLAGVSVVEVVFVSRSSGPVGVPATPAAFLHSIRPPPLFAFRPIEKKGELEALSRNRRLSLKEHD
jgi:hypothetical protein